MLWPIFGSANQLLAALALLAVTVWLYKIKQSATFVIIPMFFMFTVTLTSLFFFAWENYNKGVYALAIIAGILFLLSLVLIRLAFRSLRKTLQM